MTENQEPRWTEERIRQLLAEVADFCGIDRNDPQTWPAMLKTEAIQADSVCFLADSCAGGLDLVRELIIQEAAERRCKLEMARLRLFTQVFEDRFRDDRLLRATYCAFEFALYDALRELLIAGADFTRKIDEAWPMTVDTGRLLARIGAARPEEDRAA